MPATTEPTRRVPVTVAAVVDSAERLDATAAVVLSKLELEAAMTVGLGPGGPDPHAALVAALEKPRFRDRLPRVLDVDQIVASRRGKRCGVVMPRAQARCIRLARHPGPHRAH